MPRFSDGRGCTAFPPHPSRDGQLRAPAFYIRSIVESVYVLVVAEEPIDVETALALGSFRSSPSDRTIEPSCPRLRVRVRAGGRGR